MLKACETFEAMPVFGVTYQIRRRTRLMFGVIPLAWSQETLRI